MGNRNNLKSATLNIECAYHKTNMPG